MAADVAVFRLVPAQLGFIETHTVLPGVAAQIPTGCSLPGEAAGDLQVSLAIRTLFRNKNPEKIRITDYFDTSKCGCPYFRNSIALKLVLNCDENLTDRIYSLVNAGPQNYHNAHFRNHKKVYQLSLLSLIFFLKTYPRYCNLVI